MNALGMSRDDCLAALEGYLQKVRHIADWLARASDQHVAGSARALLDDLQFRVQVDLDARSTVAGGERMSEIEAAVFAPALRKLLSDLENGIGSRRSTQWLPALVSLEAALRDAAGSARTWQADRY